MISVHKRPGEGENPETQEILIQTKKHTHTQEVRLVK